MPFKDPDMQRFLTDLQDTGPGIRWRRAWFDVQRIVKTIKEIEKYSTPHTRQAHLLVLQRRYIQASIEASVALDELSLVHNWPPDSTAHAGFKLVAPARLQPRKAP